MEKRPGELAIIHSRPRPEPVFLGRSWAGRLQIKPSGS